jgi:hypothetical protein
MHQDGIATPEESPMPRSHARVRRIAELSEVLALAETRLSPIACRLDAVRDELDYITDPTTEYAS